MLQAKSFSDYDAQMKAKTDADHKNKAKANRGKLESIEISAADNGHIITARYNQKPGKQHIDYGSLCDRLVFDDPAEALEHVARLMGFKLDADGDGEAGESTKA